jgi:hypothetical protein
MTTTMITLKILMTVILNPDLTEERIIFKSTKILFMARRATISPKKYKGRNGSWIACPNPFGGPTYKSTIFAKLK